MAALAGAVLGCGRTSDDEGSETTAPPPVEEAPAETPACDVDQRFCTTFRRFYGLRAMIYGPPFDESPAEIEALMAQSDALIAEWERLAPEEIKAHIDIVLSGFARPIDALTEQLGWDPQAAINTDEAMAIFADAELNATSAEIDEFLERCCPVDEDLTEPTEPLVLEGRSVAVYNGTPSLNEALRWGFGRFELAGLVVPPIGSATFTVQSEMCEEIRGRYRPTDRGIELELCMDDRTACWEDPDADPDTCAGHCPEHVPGVLAIVLHEIAHAWLDANVDTIDVDRFLAHVDLDTWRDRDLPWDENGLEHAADTIAWGLMDRDIEMLRIGQPTPEELTEGFRILTGTDPLAKTE